LLLKNPSGRFNSSLEGNARRAIDFHEDDKILVSIAGRFPGHGLHHLVHGSQVGARLRSFGQ
jgi:hypothetical protein